MLKKSLYPTLLWLTSFSPLMAQQGIAFSPNPSNSWYFLTPTSFGPAPGKALFQNAMGIAFQYQKTTPRGNTVALGTIPTLFIGKQYMPMWMYGHRRFQIGGTTSKPFTTLNTGAFMMSIPHSEVRRGTYDVAAAYFNFNFGTREKNFAIGAAYLPRSFEDGHHFRVITLHGMTRLGRRSCLITENYLVSTKGSWVPASISGFRIWKKRSAFDFSILSMRIPASLRTVDKARWLAIPWLSFHQTLRRDPINWD